MKPVTLLVVVLVVLVFGVGGVAGLLLYVQRQTDSTPAVWFPAESAVSRPRTSFQALGQAPTKTPTAPRSPDSDTAPPLPEGKVPFTVSSQTHTGPEFRSGFLDPYHAPLGSTQTLSVYLKGTAAITAVSAVLQTDQKTATFPLALYEGSATDGYWRAGWIVDDSHTRIYTLTLTATDGTETSTIDLVLRYNRETSSCSTRTNEDLIIDSPCLLPGVVSGVDNGNLVIRPGATLSILNGQTLTRNNGKSIINNGTIVAFGTGKIVQSNLWCADVDVDGYCASPVFNYGDSSPGNGYRRLTEMTSPAVTDCSDRTPGNTCKRIFATRTVMGGNLGGVAGADAACQTAARAAFTQPPPGQFRAWLSGTQASAAQRLTHAAEDYILPDHTVVANGWFDLTDGSLDHAISQAADGTAITGASDVFTNSAADGSPLHTVPGSVCQDWTTNSDGAEYKAAVGDATCTNDCWTDHSVTSPCSANLLLYCLEQ